jgi:predicted molibdopterin-dependent oxidoreductase YjgC
VVFPAANVAEEDGTFVNRDGRVQRYLQAKPAPGMARPAWWILGELLAELGSDEPLGGADEAFERLAAEVDAFGGLSYARLGLGGAVLGSVRAAEVTT